MVPILNHPVEWCCMVLKEIWLPWNIRPTPLNISFALRCEQQVQFVMLLLCWYVQPSENTIYTI